MNLANDVPLLTEVQFSTLHMVLSVQGFEYRLAQDYLLPTLLADGWCVIAKLGPPYVRGMYGDNRYMLLAAPVIPDEALEEEDD